MNSIMFFPEPYPDEDFRSIIYRYHIRTCNNEIKDTRKDLFDVGSEKLGIFPRNLTYFLSKFPEGYDVSKDYFLSYTWFPLFEPFLDSSRLELVNNDILYGKKGVSNYVGKIAVQRNTRILSKVIKYCPECMKDDFVNFGECYVHMEHQLQFLNFCPKHLVELVEKCPVCKKPLSNVYKGFLASVPCCDMDNQQKKDIDNNKNFMLAFLNELLFIKKHTTMKESYILYKNLVVLVGKNGYINQNGTINKRKLIQDLKNFYPSNYLSAIGINPDIFIAKANQHYFFKKEYMSNFIYEYILVIKFLSGTVEDFLSKMDEYSIPIPFRNGPWPCKNQICPSFDKYNSIKFCKKKVKAGRAEGRFTCPICGFKYEKKEKLNPETSGEAFKVKDWGELWKTKVRYLYNSGYSINEIAEKTGGKEKIIKYYISIEGNDRKSSTDYLKEYNNKRNARKNEKREQCRNTIKSLKDSKENLKRSEAQHTAPKEYKWLFRYDRDWLDMFLPSVKQLSLDYEAIDLELKDKIRKAAKVLITTNPPKQIKKYTILRLLDPKDKGRILKNKEKLPQTLSELELHIESVEDYQVRHVPSLYKQLIAGGYVNVTLNSILSFRRSYRNCSEETKRKIEDILIKLQQRK